ncbi:hypothetical protein [Halomicronema hongdechloris]|uniref:hypothetical protein n=1 Tax=Halomicronema hongdechloris TaxID=1209493 RepID=UPI0016516B13|nr:hypothetical protein [Halomicronema hongdechloris]
MNIRLDLNASRQPCDRIWEPPQFSGGLSERYQSLAEQVGVFVVWAFAFSKA